MTLVSGVVGLLSAWVTKSLNIKILGADAVNPAIAFVIGYAGGDFIENIFKIITKKDTLFKIPSGK